MTTPRNIQAYYTARYLQGIARANREGFPITGYFHWTLRDNFEWSARFHPRFGLGHVGWGYITDYQQHAG
jgi:beta-glucosidase/6-phospho-beta-glucosidase/beta-galactosidase